MFEYIMFLVLPAMMWAGVSLAAMYERDGGFAKYIAGQLLFGVALSLFLAQVILCNI